MGLSYQSLGSLKPLTETELEEWEDAYAAVEAYLGALHIRNRLLVAELVRAILWRAGDADAGRIRHGVPVDLLVQPSMDTFGGVPRVQLVVEAMRAPEVAGVR